MAIEKWQTGAGLKNEQYLVMALQEAVLEIGNNGKLWQYLGEISSLIRETMVLGLEK